MENNIILGIESKRRELGLLKSDIASLLEITRQGYDYILRHPKSVTNLNKATHRNALVLTDVFNEYAVQGVEVNRGDIPAMKVNMARINYERAKSEYIYATTASALGATGDSEAGNKE
jgi:hypothetical protein